MAGGLQPQTPSEKFAVEVRALLYRWTEESDLDDFELAEIMAGAINSWLDEEFIVFEAGLEGNKFHVADLFSHDSGFGGATMERTGFAGRGMP